MAEKQVSTKMKARKPGKGKPTKKPAAKALDAGTASVRRGQTDERQQGYSGYGELELFEHANPLPERPAINTIPELVRALGGAKAVKEWLHIPEANVGLWQTRGQVGTSGRLEVYLALSHLGYTRIAPALFGYASWEDIRLPHMRLPATPMEPAGMEKIRHHLAVGA